MGRLRSVRPLKELKPEKNLKQLAAAEDVARADACTREAHAALGPILKKYNCRLMIRQTYIDGQPGPIEVLCATLD